MNIKKLFIILVTMAFSLAANAQDVTKFLGIPIDGSPYSMRQKLIEKGFEFIPGSDKNYGPISGGALTGIFNNEQVYIEIQKNPGTGKVWKINVCNQNGYSKSEAIRKYNNLVIQFDAKGNYTIANEYSNTHYISVYEDDEYFDINVEKQKYTAHYYQGNNEMKLVWFRISKTSYGKYNIWIKYENRYNDKNRPKKDGEDL